MKRTLILVVLACAIQICYSKSCYSCEFCGHLRKSHITWSPAPKKVKCEAETDKCGEITSFVYTGKQHDVLFSKGCFSANFNCLNFSNNRTYIDASIKKANEIFGISFGAHGFETTCDFCSGSSLCNSSSSLHMWSLLLYSLFGIVWFFKYY